MTASPRVFVARRIPEAGLALLRDCVTDVWSEALPPSQESLLERVRGVDAILSLLTDRIDGAVLDAAGPQLKVVSNLAVGVDNVDVAELTRRRIPLGHTPGVLTETTADLAFSLLCAAARRVPEADAFTRAGLWKTWEPTLLLGRDLHGATLGIVGLGRIGRAMAKRASGFSMRVLAATRGPGEPMPGVERVGLDRLLAESDFVSLHAPLTTETRHLINTTTLAQMKPTAILINTARGGLVDSAALAAALKSDRLAGAALDVTEPEPIPLDDPLLTAPRCIILPHIGSASVQTRDKMATIAARNVLAALHGEPLLHCANPEVYAR